ncbi:MAG: hypothetical protein M3169_09810 [Candidatus Eremiobacteraeota bacterium]|nr:hypothetical protein [Candidatus Eremiobacteraeota bacterium]
MRNAVMMSATVIRIRSLAQGIPVPSVTILKYAMKRESERSSWRTFVTGADRDVPRLA